MNYSNLHPAVVGSSLQNPVDVTVNGISPAKNLFGSGGFSPIASTFESKLTMNETLARTRARELMQSYARDKKRAAELEQQAVNLKINNDELAYVSSNLQKQVSELREYIVQQEETFAKERGHYEQLFSATKAEMNDVTALSAHQVGDLLAQLRLRDEEISHVKNDLSNAVEENKRLQTDLARISAKISGFDPVELQKAQGRSVELARRLLESERAKRAAEDALIEDRKHHHMALNTIEQLRQQLATSEGRVDVERRKREEEVNQLRKQLEQVREDFDQRENAYKKTLQNESTLIQENQAKSTSNSANQSLALLCSTLEARTQSQQEHIDFLSEQNEKITSQLQLAIFDLHTEKTRRVDEATQAQELIRNLKDDRTRKELMNIKKDKERVVAALADLKGLYEESINHFARTCERAASNESTVISQTLAEIHKALRSILNSCKLDVPKYEECETNQAQRLIELLTHQITSGSGTDRAASSSVAGGEADEFVDASKDSGRFAYLQPNSDQRFENLKRSLDEAERSKAHAIQERDELAAIRERELRSQIEQLVAHTQRLQRQSSLDEEEIDNLRFQLQSAEANASFRIARVRKDCIRNIETLQNVLKKIEEDHNSILSRRFTNETQSFGSLGFQSSRNGKEESGATEMLQMLDAERKLGSRIQEAIESQEILLSEWRGRD